MHGQILLSTAKDTYAASLASVIPTAFVSTVGQTCNFIMYTPTVYIG